MMLTDLVTAAAVASPDADAIVGLSERLSWQQLERASASVAGFLAERGVVAGDRVAIACLKDTQSYVAAHGILRAGAIVVPVDPLAPRLHAEALLTDADPTAVIGDARTVSLLAPWEMEGLNLRTALVSGDCDHALVVPWQDVLDSTPSAHPVPVSADSPAYIIYTSGSSGRPKGILHTHGSGMAYAERAAGAHGLSSQDRVAGMSPLHFDMSTFELYASPLAGAAVVVMGEGHLRFPASFTDRCQQEQVSVWYSVPTLFRHVVERGAMDQRDLSRLRLIMYGGEPYPAAALTDLMAAAPEAQVKNVYGPAEVNECTNHTVRTPPPADAQVPIGRPWNGVKLRVVDQSGEAVPRGTAGELWVSAPTVMTEYWKQPERTKASLHQRADAPPWYATGDIAVEDEHGTFWFNGRLDHQLKIRGIRLELESVESVLGDAPGVVAAVVGPIDLGAETAHLVAAVVLQDGVTFDSDTLRRWCADRVPQVAVPVEIMQWSEFAQTPTGKIDRRSVRAELRNEGALQ